MQVYIQICGDSQLALLLLLLLLLLLSVRRNVDVAAFTAAPCIRTA